MFAVHDSRTRRQCAEPPDSGIIAGVAAGRSDQQSQGAQVERTTGRAEIQVILWKPVVGSQSQRSRRGGWRQIRSFIA